MNTPGSFEVELLKFIKAFKHFRGSSFSKENNRQDKLEKIVYPYMEWLVKTFVREGLEKYSDIRYDELLVQPLLEIENFTDLIEGRENEYTIRKHVRNIVRLYIAQIKKDRAIKVTDKAQLGAYLESLGLNIGFTQPSSGSERSIVPDGNSSVLAVLTLGIAFIALAAAVMIFSQ